MVGKSKRLASLAVSAALLLHGSSGMAQPETVLHFDDGSTVVGFPPESNQATLIRAYSEEVVQYNGKLITAHLSGLGNFETTIRSATADDASPKLGAAVLRSLLANLKKAAVKEGDKLLPGTELIVSAVDAATSEVERAAAAAESAAVGDWIRDTRSKLTDSFTAAKTESGVRAELRKALEEAVRGDEGKCAGACNDLLNEISDATDRYRAMTVPSTKSIERGLYEEWVNAQFAQVSDDAKGCVALRFEAENGTASLDEATIQAAMAEKIEDGLRDVNAAGGSARLLKLSIRKRVCFHVPGLGIGTTWDCGWLGRDNEVLKLPSLEAARTLFSGDSWREVSDFRR